MTTTLSTKFANANANYCYSSPPTIDVEIVDDTTAHCQKPYCNEVVVNDATAYALPQWRHVNPLLDNDHRAYPAPRCFYCRAENTVTTSMQSWHDSTDCSRCGGSHGYPIGD